MSASKSLFYINYDSWMQALRWRQLWWREIVYSKDMITKQVNSLLSSENKQCISSYILQEISQSIIENSEGILRGAEGCWGGG